MNRIVKTGLSGAASTSVDVVGIVLLIEVAGLPIGVAAFLASSVGAIMNFLLSKYWAFNDKSPLDPKQVAKYAGVALFTALLNACTIHVLAVVIGFQYLAAKAMAAISIFLLWSYPAQAKLVFPKSRKQRCPATGKLQTQH